MVPRWLLPPAATVPRCVLAATVPRRLVDGLSLLLERMVPRLLPEPTLELRSMVPA